MKFLSKIFNRSTPVKNTEKTVEENVEETYQKQKMTDGYPVTMTPFVPKIMKNAIVQKKITSQGRPAFGLTFSSQKSNLVNIECLEKIRKQLLEMYVNFPEVMKELEKPIPSNTIAISFVMCNFQLGESCQNFLPIETFKVPNDAFYTYQKLSENLQATFYNENGIQFLAGFCYYPAPNGTPMIFTNDKASIDFVMSAAEPYPLQDREKMHFMINYKKYGRYCKETGKRVWVDCSGTHGVICHVEYDHFSNKYTHTPCDECLKDAFTYKWEEPKMQDPKHDDSLKFSNTTTQASELPSAPSTKKQETEQIDLIEVIKKFLKMIGVQTSELSMLSSLPNDTKLPMINEITKETLPESKCPQVKDLTSFMMANSDWCIDFSSLKEKAVNGTGAEFEASSGGKTDLMKSRSEESEVLVAMDSLTLSRTTTNLDALTSSALSESPSSASSTENLLKDFDKVEDATERDNEVDAELVN